MQNLKQKTKNENKSENALKEYKKKQAIEKQKQFKKSYFEFYDDVKNNINGVCDW